MITNTSNLTGVNVECSKVTRRTFFGALALGMAPAIYGVMTNAQMTAEIQILSHGERVPRDPRDAAALCRTLSRSAELCGPKTQRRVRAVVAAYRAWIAAQTI